MGDPRRDLSVLDQFKQTPFVPRYPADRRVFYAPVDDVHAVLIACVASAEKDLAIAMYGFDDDELANIIMDKINDERVNVTLVLDRSQAGGKHESAILNAVNTGAPQTEVVIGDSEDHAIMHLKTLIIDGCLTVSGSTNWSDSGETKQDNQATVDIDPYIAVEASHRIHAIRLSMLSRARKIARQTSLS